MSGAVLEWIRGGAADALWREVSERRNRAHLMAVGGWLWRTGVTDEAAVRFLIRCGQQRRARNWFAYYAAGGTRRREALLEYQRQAAEFNQGGRKQ